MSHAAPKAECWMQVLGEGGREHVGGSVPMTMPTVDQGTPESFYTV